MADPPREQTLRLVGRAQVLRRRDAGRGRGPARDRPHAAEGRIRRVDRPVGLGQDDAAQSDRAARHAHGRTAVHRRPGDGRAGRDGSHTVARARDRLHLPVSLSAAGVHRARERDDADAGRTGKSRWRDADDGHKPPGACGPGGMARSQDVRHFRRPAAARRDRPRAGDDPAAGAGGRAHRQSRHRKRGRGLRPDARCQRDEPAPRSSSSPTIPRLARRCDRIIELVDGRIVSDAPNFDVVRRGESADVAEQRAGT